MRLLMMASGTVALQSGIPTQGAAPVSKSSLRGLSFEPPHNHSHLTTNATRMKPLTQPDSEAQRRPPTYLWDTLIRVALIGGLAWLCFQVFSPFLKLMVWSIILAITLYPLHQRLARMI